MMPLDIAIVVAFHSPLDYELPKQHLQRVLDDMVSTGATVVCAQVVLPHQQPQPVPQACKSIVYATDSVMFHKENLWDLGADAVEEPKLAFVDADVVFDRDSWLVDASKILDDCAILQPFSQAVWMKRDGGVEEETRIASALPLSEQRDPYPGRHHPGFAWCVTRDAWQAMGGWWDRDALGGGDTAFAYALATDEHAKAWCDRTPTGADFWHRPTYQQFRHRVQQAAMKVGFLEGQCLHMWHGDRSNRRYLARDLVLPQYRRLEFPLRRREDKLLEWAEPLCNSAMLRFFESRREDG